jgi:hypothetical protein
MSSDYKNIFEIKFYNEPMVNSIYFYELFPRDLDLDFKMFDIIGANNHTYNQLTETILKYLLTSWRHHYIEEIIELLQYIRLRNPFVIKIINEFQLRVCDAISYNQYYKLWVKYFPMESDKLIKIIMDNRCYSMKKILKDVPVRDILGEKYFDTIYNKLLSMFTLYRGNCFDNNDFSELHSIITLSTLNKNECFVLENKLIKLPCDVKYVVITMLRLKNYNFDSCMSSMSYYSTAIALDWCMREYIIHNSSPKIIWQFIFKNNYVCHEIAKQIIIFYNFAKEHLYEDIMLNITLLYQLMIFDEFKDAELPIYRDYEIIYKKKIEK